MSLRIEVREMDTILKLNRERQIQNVLDHFGALPASRLLCFIDDRNAFENLRGFYKPITEGMLWGWGWPDYLRNIVYAHASARAVSFDHVIYVSARTCSNEIGLTMTLAHELQHFVQHVNYLRLWAANSLVGSFFMEPGAEKLGFQWCDVPIEREARIVAKRVSEEFFGADRVRNFIDHKISEHLSDADVADWECIQKLDSSTPYDLGAETTLFFSRMTPFAADIQRIRADTNPLQEHFFKDVDLAVLLSSPAAGPQTSR